MNISQSRSNRSRADIWSNEENYGGHSSSKRRNRTPSPTVNKRREDRSDQWTCIKCSIKNYNRRQTCFKCGVSRNESEMLDAKGYTMVGVVPNDTLLIRELPSSATADSIGQALMASSGVPIQRVQISASRRYAFVQLESNGSAAAMLNSFQKVVPHVDNCAVIANYSKYSFDELAEQGIVRKPINAEPLPIQPPPQPPSAAAGTVMTPFGQLQIHEPPDTKTFKLEPTSGYFYDNKSGFYYDPKSDYYYNPKTNQWMFWCSKFSAYINCEGGDLEMKTRLQEEERDFQFRQKFSQQDKTEVEGRTTSRRVSMDVPPPFGESALQMVEGHSRAGDGERVKEIPSVKDLAAMKADLMEKLEQNAEFMNMLHDELRTTTDQNSIAKKYALAEELQKQRKTLEASLATIQQQQKQMAASTSSQSAIPQFKRQITKNIMNQSSTNNGHGRPPSVVELLDDDDPNDWRPAVQNNPNSWRQRTAFDEHIEQTEQLRKLAARKELERRIANEKREMMAEEQLQMQHPELFEQAKQLRLAARTKELERRIADAEREEMMAAQQMKMQPQMIVDHRPNQRHEMDREKRRRSSPSIERDRERGRRYRSSRSPSPRSHSRRRRSRSRSRHRDRGYEERRRSDRRRSNSPPTILRGQEPMTISPPPPPMLNKSANESWINAPAGGQLGMGMPMGGMGGLNTQQAAATQFLAMGSPPNVMFGQSPAAGVSMQSHQPMQMFPPVPSNPSQQFIGIGQPSNPMIGPSSLGIGGGTIPMGIPTPGMPFSTQQKQFFPSNDDHWRQAARLQQEFLAGKMPGSSSQFNSGTINENMLSSMQTPKSAGPSTQLCTNCLCFGHSRINCPVDKSKQSRERDRDLNQEKLEVVEKERNKLHSLGICFNCGRPGHTQFGCRHSRISDDELQRKIRKAEENLRRKEIDKERLKRKAEKYPVRRKDLFIERLREVAPRGKITKELIRSVCARCSSLNHNASECKKRWEAARSIYKEVCQALEEFTKVFFVHLNENNLVDFSQKFDTFTVMDAIEQAGSIDPVRLQLQSRCKDGIVTQGDLRELCSKCANLGHKQQDCGDKDGCSRTHFEKMLTLVKGYRALVREGNGNFLLPNARENQNRFQNAIGVINKVQQQQPSASNNVPIDEIVLLESSDDEEKEEDDEEKNGKDANNDSTNEKEESNQNVENGEEHQQQANKNDEMEDENDIEIL